MKQIWALWVFDIWTLCSGGQNAVIFHSLIFPTLNLQCTGFRLGLFSTTVHCVLRACSSSGSEAHCKNMNDGIHICLGFMVSMFEISFAMTLLAHIEMNLFWWYFAHGLEAWCAIFKRLLTPVQFFAAKNDWNYVSNCLSLSI